MAKRNQHKTDQRAMSQHTEAVIKLLNDAEDRYFQTWRDRKPPKPPEPTKETT